MHARGPSCSLTLSLLLAAAACLLASPAFGFEQTMTCTESGIYACDPDEQPKPVEWPRACVAYRINEVGTQNVGDAAPGLSEQLERAVTDSFDTWVDVDCSRMELVYDGLTELSAAEFDNRSGATNVNLVVWRDDNWSAVASSQTFALTSVSYNPNTGEIADADIEINAEFYPVSTSDPVEESHIDLRNTLVHEVGHFIGLDHTPVEEATMYARADVGETDKRTLHPDDIDGICHIYPVTEQLQSGCADDPPAEDPGPGSDSSCATAGTSAPTELTWLLAAAVMGLVGWRRRVI